MMEPIPRKWILVLGCVALRSGCATADSISSARASLDRAKTAGAVTKAPSDYYMAEAYFDAANREVKEGDNKEARYFADQSGKYSGQALRKAGRGAN